MTRGLVVSFDVPPASATLPFVLAQPTFGKVPANSCCLCTLYVVDPPPAAGNGSSNNSPSGFEFFPATQRGRLVGECICPLLPVVSDHP